VECNPPNPVARPGAPEKKVYQTKPVAFPTGHGPGDGRLVQGDKQTRKPERVPRSPVRPCGYCSLPLRNVYTMTPSFAPVERSAAAHRIRSLREQAGIRTDLRGRADYVRRVTKAEDYRRYIRVH
jgi:hypothetical protein